MKKALLIVGLSIFILGVKAQQADKKTVDTTKYFRVEVDPTFPGGIQNLYQFITKTGKSTGDKGKVFVTFVVEKDGSLTDIKIGKGLSEKADKEALRIMNNCPKWIPGMQAGRPVRAQYTIPINFN